MSSVVLFQAGQDPVKEGEEVFDGLHLSDRSFLTITHIQPRDLIFGTPIGLEHGALVSGFDGKTINETWTVDLKPGQRRENLPLGSQTLNLFHREAEVRGQERKG